MVRTDPTAFGPTVQFRYQRELEPPETAEGFSEIDVVAFERRRNASFTNRALIVWCDGVLVRSRSGRRSPLSLDDAEMIGASGAKLRRYADEGWLLLGLSWQPDIAAETLSVAMATAIFDRVREELGVPIEVSYCPHGGGPPACWCRKPLPGLGVALSSSTVSMRPGASMSETARRILDSHVVSGSRTSTRRRFFAPDAWIRPHVLPRVAI